MKSAGKNILWMLSIVTLGQIQTKQIQQTFPEKTEQF